MVKPYRIKHKVSGYFYQRYSGNNLTYYIQSYLNPIIIHGLIPTFNNKEDSETVMNNPNFKGILDLLYKGNED